uniref:Thioredoxin domain-containing protein n=1 Tax=Salix viminalis TaxID=40686 RepID=A0A6N2KX80_SALVM
MESQEQQPKSRVIKVQSVESWDFYSTQATNQPLPCEYFSTSFMLRNCHQRPYITTIGKFYNIGDEWRRVVIKRVSLIVVHFTALWCMPSVAMNPIFEELASAYPDALFLTVDVDEAKEVAAKMEVKAMPTFVLMKDGAEADKIVGANPEEIRKRIAGFVQSIRAYNA